MNTILYGGNTPRKVTKTWSCTLLPYVRSTRPPPSLWHQSPYLPLATSLPWGALPITTCCHGYLSLHLLFLPMASHLNPDQKRAGLGCYVTMVTPWSTCVLGKGVGGVGGWGKLRNLRGKARNLKWGQYEEKRFFRCL